MPIFFIDTFINNWSCVLFLVNLCRSSFLAPSYFEDLDDVSSTSSLSEVADNEEMQAPPQHEAFKRDTPPPELSAIRTARHAPVTRTASVQPGFGTPSLPFGKSQSQIGPITSTRESKIVIQFLKSYMSKIVCYIYLVVITFSCLSIHF